jgi:hypothetical protein
MERTPNNTLGFLRAEVAAEYRRNVAAKTRAMLLKACATRLRVEPAASDAEHVEDAEVKNEEGEAV